MVSRLQSYVNNIPSVTACDHQDILEAGILRGFRCWLQMLQQGLKELRHRERQDELTISKQQREIAALQLSLQGMRQQLKVHSQQASLQPMACDSGPLH